MKISIRIAIAASIVTLTACQTSAPYQALVPTAAKPEGYSQLQLQPDRWRVTYLAPRHVQHRAASADLLRRAAQLTVDQGYDWFTTAGQEGATYHGESGGGVSHADWSDAETGFGTADWDPSRSDPTAPPPGTPHTPGWYEVSEEIVLHRGARPQPGTGAFDARAILARMSASR